MSAPDEENVRAWLLEEVKVFKEGSAEVVPTSPSKKVPGMSGISPREGRLLRAAEVCNALMGMGFKYGTVVALLKYCEVPDVQAGVDLLLKTPQGWPHAYVPNAEGTGCEICEERFSEHLEAAFGDRNDPAPTRRPPLQEFGRVFETSAEEAFGGMLPRSTVQCNVCMDGIPFGQEHHLSCGHMHCRGCVENFLITSITNGVVLDLKCPEPGCESRFTQRDIQKVCKKPIYEKYLKFRENVEVTLSKNMRWCPAPNCGRHIIGTRQKARVTCACGFQMCFKCGEAWHGGVSCAKNLEKLYSSWAQGKKIQRCPKCNIRIEKAEGCNHMTCSCCHYQWCWICGQKYSSGHYDSLLFGCPMLQFTSSDWTLKKIALFQLLILFLCPLLCFYWSGKVSIEWFCARASDCETGRCLVYCIIPIAIIIVIPILFLIMLLPVFCYRLYNLFFLVRRIFRT